MKMGEAKYVMKHEMHLSLQFFGLVDKQKIEGVGHSFSMLANQRKCKKPRYFRIKPKRDSCYFHSVFSSDFLDSWSASALRISGI